MKRLLGRTVVLFDSHPLLLQALEKRLEGWGMEVVASAADLDAAIEAAGRHAPDVLIIGGAGGDPEGTVRRAGESAPGAKIVLLSDDERPDAVDAAFRSGASAYVLKSADPEDIATALRQLFEQQLFFAAPGGTAERRPDPGAEEHPLTARELEILRLAARGMSNAAMARKLWVTEQTVKFHLSNVYRKLGVANRTEAARWAHRRGLLTDDADDTEAHRGVR